MILGEMFDSDEKFAFVLGKLDKPVKQLVKAYAYGIYDGSAAAKDQADQKEKQEAPAEA